MESYFSFSFEGRNALKEKYIRNVDRVVFFCYGRIEGEEKRRPTESLAQEVQTRVIEAFEVSTLVNFIVINFIYIKKFCS